ncbi:site-specific recombinase [Paraburkholderia caballeronis]|nr:site-specific recombinase [Paraburkholderia caballeronis]
MSAARAGPWALALLMAVRSRGLRRSEVWPLVRAIWRRIARHPLDLVWPLRARRDADAGGHG